MSNDPRVYNTKQRLPLKVVTWDTEAGAGVLIDKQGEQYPVTSRQLDATFAKIPPRVGEILEGCVDGPGRVSDVTDPKTERINFDSVGANPDGDEVAQELGRRLEGGTPDTGLRGGQPDSGRFSRPPEFPKK